MNTRRSLALLSSLCLAGTLLVPSLAFAQPKSYNPNPAVQDIGPKLRSETLSEVIAENRLDLSGSESSDASASSGTASAAVSPSDVGMVKRWLTNDDYTGQYRLTPFTLRAVGTYGEVWVANDLNFPVGDPRNSMVQITDAQVNYLLNEFDNRMYAKEIEFFAPPAERKGEDGYNGLYVDDVGRTVILIDNIKDQSYYDSNYPSYIAGYFSPTMSEFADRNIMTIDNFDWLNRTGPNAARPYLYEGVFAHEFQHLLHYDTDAGEDNFINEGLSDFAQYMVGYGHSQGHVDFFMTHLRNSLTLWGDQSDLQILGDYGNAYLFQLYLFEQYGESFIRNLFHNQNNGMSSVEEVLAQSGVNKTFDQVYSDYMSAVMTDNFSSIKLSPDLGASVLSDNVTPAWGTDFKVITPDKKIDHLYFKGLDFLGTKWTTAQDSERGAVLWGNTGNLTDNFLIKELDLTGKTAPVLSFDTKYDIEEAWDYGLVQVSTDQGQTWTSLSNANTRSDLDPQGHPNIEANLPGFTGHSGGWTTETFDLSAYAGRKVLLAFRYMTDWGFNEAGWYLSNLRLDGAQIDPMTATSGFMSLEEVTGQYADYQVQFIGFKKGDGNGNKESKTKVIRFPNLLNMSEQDRLELGNMLRSAEFGKVVMMTTLAAPEGTNNSATYEYEVVMKTNKAK